jgi:hypothetical protein
LPEHLGRFDAAFAAFWISEVPRERLRIFLAGLHARLHPGSLVLFIDHLRVPGGGRGVASRPSGVPAEGSPHRVPTEFPSEAFLRDLIEGMGTDPHYRTFDYYWGFHYRTASKAPSSSRNILSSRPGDLPFPPPLTRGEPLNNLLGDRVVG